MTDRDPSHWRAYNTQQSGRDVRTLLVEALTHVGDRVHPVAVDIGCGAGIESRWLLEHGWTVHAIDADERSLAELRDAVRDGESRRLHTVAADLNDLPPLPTADLAYSGYALPFTDPARFDRTWRTLRDALAPGAVLAVNLFGEHDSWAAAGVGTFLTEADCRALLDGLEVLHFAVEDEDGAAYSGPKHWHVFDVIARRPLTRS
ncbi:MAG: class I SAM-dependent methyltransferase [Angustibacter sp.]